MLDRILAEAERDPDTLGVLVTGSHAAGTTDHESDYDVVWVLTEEARELRRQAGMPHHVKEMRDDGVLDGVYASPSELREIAEHPGWYTAGFAEARVLLDKTGEVEELLEAIRTMPQERARVATAESFDAYLNSYYRSLKAWRRGDELAGRIEAAESVMHLVRTLFALELRPAPYPKRLREELCSLGEQGWPAGYLERTLLALVSTGDPAVQQELEGRVERLLRGRGHGAVVDGWEGEIERVSAFPF